MPELPEVEIVCRGLAASFVGHRLTGVIRRFDRLRWPIPDALDALIRGPSGPDDQPSITDGAVLASVTRRSKYLLLGFPTGTLLIHLGMSGTLRRLSLAVPPRAHDHLDLIFGEQVLRLNDPRRFGAVLWSPFPVEETVADHVLLRGLGVEPFTEQFNAAQLYAHTRGRTASIKQLLLSGDAVVGVGNIYASESLFRAGIRPSTPAGRLTRTACERLVETVRATLTEAIAAGGSTLRDFVASTGESGYFQLSCFVYGREGEPCRVCGTLVRSIRQQQRSSFFCPRCQPPVGRKPPRVG